MAYRWLGVMLLGVACAAGCDGGGAGNPFSGTGATGGDGGAAGMGGGQTGGSGGTAGAAGAEPIACTTSLICRSCPADDLCDTSDDCTVGSVCIESGCEDPDGTPIKQCAFAGGGACTSNATCPSGRTCEEVPGEGKRCVKLTPGCDTSFDCVKGFTCENGACVDRRLPCDLDAHCPKNHVCIGGSKSTFCVRVQTDCLAAFDCVDVAPSCVDVDGDGSLECAGTFDPNDPLSAACINDDCTDDGSPVCEVSEAGSTTQCGQYGLCSDGTDCADGFSCVGLWPDGRKECVPTAGASCSSYTDCGVREVCASPREGGPPSCQAGFQP